MVSVIYSKTAIYYVFFDSKTVKFCKSEASKPNKHTLSHHFRDSEDWQLSSIDFTITALLI